MPNKPRETTCVNCGETFSFAPRFIDDMVPRLYCSRRCTLIYQRAKRKNKFTPEQLENTRKAQHKPSEHRDYLQPGRNAEGQRYMWGYTGDGRLD